MSAQVPLLSLNGKVVPYADANVHMLTPALKYGAAVFEGIRGYWNEGHQQMYLFRLDDHLERLRYAMRVMRFDEVYSLDYMRKALIDLLVASNFRETVHIRMIAFLDGDGELTATGPVGLAIAALPRADKGKPQGLRVNVSSWRRISDTSMPARLKSISNYLNSRLAGIDAKAGGYDYALLLNAAGKVAEGQTSSFFMARRGKVLTPTVSDDILEGITRDTLLSILRNDLGEDAIERSIDRSELYDADEAFFCGSGPEIKPVLSIDGVQLGTGDAGPITNRIIDRYRALVTGASDDHPEWRTPVYG